MSDSTFCDVCSASLDAGAGTAVPHGEMAPLVARGFGPWCPGAPDLALAVQPSLAAPRLARVMWRDRIEARGHEWTVCTSCREEARRFDRDGPAAPQDLLSAHDWLAAPLAELQAAPLPPLPDLPGDPSPQVVELAQQIARDIAALPMGGSAADLAPGYAPHGEAWGLAAANVLLGGYSGASRVEDANLMMIRLRAVDLVGAWDDPRATACLVAALDNGGQIHSIAGALGKRPHDERVVLPVIQRLATLLAMQDRIAGQLAGPSGRPPFKSLFANAEARPFVRSEAEFLDAWWASTAISWLLRLVMRFPRPLARQVLHEVWVHSLFVDGLRNVAEEIATLEAAEDVELVAFGVALQGLLISFGESSFHARLDALERHGGAAAYWGMNRFCETASHWTEQVPAVKKRRARLTRPPDAELRRLDTLYGPILDHEAAAGKSSSTSNGAGGCFIATAALGSEQAAGVVTLRAFREACLRPSRPGRALIAAYEWASPPLARVIARSAARRRLARVAVVGPARIVAEALLARRSPRRSER